MSDNGLSAIQTPIHPSETVRFMVEARGMNIHEFAETADIPEDVFSSFMNCESGITEEFARVLATFFDIPEESWMNVQKSYELQCAEFERKFQHEEEVFNKLDCNFFVGLGFVGNVTSALDKYKQLLHFLKVDLLKDIAQEDPAIAYKHSANEEKELLCANAWVKTALYVAENKEVSKYSRKSLESFVPEIRQMTLQKPVDFQPRLQEIFSQSGVVFVVLPTLKDSRVNGAVKWISDEKVLLAINDNGQDADKFWFALFHEIKHIFQEKRQQTFISLEGDVQNFGGVILEKDVDNNYAHLEEEADNYARNVLIPNADYDRFKDKGEFGKEAIIALAEEISIDKGIVVGRLQHDGLLIPKDKFDELKTQYYVSVNSRNETT